MSLYPNNIVSANNITFPIIFYCDHGDINRRLSNEGTKLRTQDYGDSPTGGEMGAVDDAIWDATETINYYCFTHYEPGHLKTSGWINRRAVDLAVYLLSIRRGNTPTASMEKLYKQAIMWLEGVHSAKYEVPGIPVRATQAPAFSNVRIDQRYPVQRIRVETVLSERTPTPYAQPIDWSAAYEYSDFL
jgi:phage gp36-like protein